MRGFRSVKTILLLAALSLVAGCQTGGTKYTSCKVESNPSSAEVWVATKTDDAEKAESTQRDSTPCELLFKKAGEYEVRIKKPGYQTVMRLVTVVEEKGEAGTELKALPPNMTITLDPVEGGDEEKKNGEKKKDPKYYDE